MPASAQAEAGRIRVVRGPWLPDFFAEAEKFADWDSLPDEEVPAHLPHDDQIDALSGATHVLITGGTPHVS
jgi:phage terminase large subunit-like protein